MHKIVFGERETLSRRMAAQETPAILRRGTSNDPSMAGVVPRYATESCGFPRGAAIVMEENLTDIWISTNAFLHPLYLPTGLDERYMGRLYVPKAPKKRSDCFSKSKIIARAVFGSLFTSKKFVPASRRILSVCPPSIYEFLLLRRPRFTRLSNFTTPHLSPAIELTRSFANDQGV